MASYILLPTNIRESKLWEPDRPRTKLEALIDLSILSQTDETISERKLADRWKWPKTKVHRFILELRKVDQLLDHNLDQKRTAINLTELELLAFTETKKEPPKRPPERPLLFDEKSLEMIISNYIYKRILELNPKFKEPNLQSWCKEVDAIIRIDKRDTTELRELIDWIYGHSFWRGVILSPAKLRNQYDSINTKRLTEKQGNGALFNDPPH